MGWVILLIVVAALIGFGAIYDHRRRLQLRNDFASEQERRNYQLEKPTAPPTDYNSNAGGSGF